MTLCHVRQYIPLVKSDWIILFDHICCLLLPRGFLTAPLRNKTALLVPMGGSQCVFLFFLFKLCRALLPTSSPLKLVCPSFSPSRAREVMRLHSCFYRFFLLFWLVIHSIFSNLFEHQHSYTVVSMDSTCSSFVVGLVPWDINSSI